MNTTTHLSPPVTTGLHGLRGLLLRWPTHVGAVVALATVGGAHAGLLPTSIALVAAGAYLGTALVGDPRVSWLFLLATFVLLGGTQALGLDPHLATVAVVVPAALWWLVARGRGRGPREPGQVVVQLVGLAGFGALALVAVLLEPAAAIRVGGVALLAHAAWDAWHLHRRRTVAPSAAEFCGVLDVVLGTALLLGL